MNIKSFAAAVFAVALSVSVHAETYTGVQTIVPARSKNDLNEEAIQAANVPNQNIPRGSRGAEAFTPMVDPEAIRAQAATAARAPNQNVPSGSRYNSKVLSPSERTVDAGVSHKDAPISK